MRHHVTGFVGAAWLAACAGCAQLPAAPAPGGTAPAAAMPQADCGELRFEQWGRMVRSDGQSVTIDREAFVIHFTAAARDAAWLHATAGDSVLAGMDPVRDRELWLPAGLGMAAGRKDDLLLASESQVAVGAQARRLAALPFTVVRTRDAATGGLALRVNTIHGRPVAQTRMRHLHLVVLTVLETPADDASPYRAAWSGCSVVIRGV